MIRSNLALVLPYPLPFSLPSALPSSCIFNELFTIVCFKLGQLHKCWRFHIPSHLFTIVCFKLGQLHKCWRFHIPSHLLPFGAVVDHPSLQKKCSPIHKRNSMSASTCEVVQRPYYVLFRATFCTGLRTKSTVLVRRNYDRTTTTVRERLFVSYCIRTQCIDYAGMANT